MMSVKHLLVSVSLAALLAAPAFAASQQQQQGNNTNTTGISAAQNTQGAQQALSGISAVTVAHEGGYGSSAGMLGDDNNLISAQNSALQAGMDANAVQGYNQFGATGSTGGSGDYIGVSGGSSANAFAQKGDPSNLLAQKAAISNVVQAKNYAQTAQLNAIYTKDAQAGLVVTSQAVSNAIANPALAFFAQILIVDGGTVQDFQQAYKKLGPQAQAIILAAYKQLDPAIRQAFNPAMLQKLATVSPDFALGLIEQMESGADPARALALEQKVLQNPKVGQDPNIWKEVGMDPSVVTSVADLKKGGGNKFASIASIDKRQRIGFTTF